MGGADAGWRCGQVREDLLRVSLARAVAVMAQLNEHVTPLSKLACLMEVRNPLGACSERACGKPS